jgi:hypothetical protein
MPVMRWLILLLGLAATTALPAQVAEIFNTTSTAAATSTSPTPSRPSPPSSTAARTHPAPAPDNCDLDPTDEFLGCETYDGC